MWNGRVYNGFTLGEDYGHAARVARRCLGFLDDVVEELLSPTPLLVLLRQYI